MIFLEQPSEVHALTSVRGLEVFKAQECDAGDPVTKSPSKEESGWSHGG